MFDWSRSYDDSGNDPGGRPASVWWLLGIIVAGLIVVAWAVLL